MYQYLTLTAVRGKTRWNHKDFRKLLTKHSLLESFYKAIMKQKQGQATEKACFHTSTP